MTRVPGKSKTGFERVDRAKKKKKKTGCELSHPSPLESLLIKCESMRGIVDSYSPITRNRISIGNEHLIIVLFCVFCPFLPGRCAIN